MLTEIIRIDDLHAEKLTMTIMDPLELELRLADRDREYGRRFALLERAANAAADTQPARLLGLVKEIVARVHAQGYVIVPGVLTPMQLDRVRDGLAPLFAAARRMFDKLDPQSPRQTFHVHNVLAKSRAADEVALHPLLRASIAGILGHDFLLHAGAVAMAPDPGCAPQDLHRDDGSYWVLPRPRLPLVVTAAFALDGFTTANGATFLVPGSCSWPASRRPKPGEVIQCEMSAGSMLLWDGAVFHAGGANTTHDQSRRTLALNYTRGWLRTQYNQFLSIPRTVLLSMPPELQRDLGYGPSEKGLGACDNQDPLAYLRRMFAAGGDGVQLILGEEARL